MCCDFFMEIISRHASWVLQARVLYHFLSMVLYYFCQKKNASWLRLASSSHRSWFLRLTAKPIRVFWWNISIWSPWCRQNASRATRSTCGTRFWTLSRATFRLISIRTRRTRFRARICRLHWIERSFLDCCLGPLCQRKATQRPCWTLSLKSSILTRRRLSHKKVTSHKHLVLF